MLWVFLLLLAGRFSLERLSPTLSGIDVRWVLLCVSALALGLWVAVEAPPKRIRRTPSGTLFFVLWVFWLVLSLAWAPPSVDAGSEIENLVLLAVVVLIAGAVFQRLGAPGVRFIWWLFLISGVTYLIAALVEGAGALGRFSAFGGGPNVFVRVVSLGAIAALALGIERGRSRWLLVFAPILAISALLSGSRGGFLAVVIVLFAAIVPIVKRLGWKATLGLVVVFAFGAWGFVRLLGEAQLQLMYVRYIERPLTGGDFSMRDVLAGFAIQMFAANPLAGAGVGAVADGLSYRGEGYYAHNLLLATGAESGIIGLALLILATTLLLAGSLRRRPLTGDVLFCLVGGAYVFVASLFSGDYYDSRFGWVLLLFAALLGRGDRVEKEETGGLR